MTTRPHVPSGGESEAVGAEVWGGGCECLVTPESDWLSAASCGYGGGYEPGSQVEFNPDCPIHGDPAQPARSQQPDLSGGAE